MFSRNPSVLSYSSNATCESKSWPRRDSRRSYSPTEWLSTSWHRTSDVPFRRGYSRGAPTLRRPVATRARTGRRHIKDTPHRDHRTLCVVRLDESVPPQGISSEQGPSVSWDVTAVFKPSHSRSCRSSSSWLVSTPVHGEYIPKCSPRR